MQARMRMPIEPPRDGLLSSPRISPTRPPLVDLTKDMTGSLLACPTMERTSDPTVLPMRPPHGEPAHLVGIGLPSDERSRDATAGRQGTLSLE